MARRIKSEALSGWQARLVGASHRSEVVAFSAYAPCWPSLTLRKSCAFAATIMVDNLPAANVMPFLVELVL